MLLQSSIPRRERSILYCFLRFANPVVRHRPSLSVWQRPRRSGVRPVSPDGRERVLDALCHTARGRAGDRLTGRVRRLGERGGPARHQAGSRGLLVDEFLTLVEPPLNGRCVLSVPGANFESALWALGLRSATLHGFDRPGGLLAQVPLARPDLRMLRQAIRSCRPLFRAGSPARWKSRRGSKSPLGSLPTDGRHVCCARSIGGTEGLSEGSSNDRNRRPKARNEHRWAVLRPHQPADPTTSARPISGCRNPEHLVLTTDAPAEAAERRGRPRDQWSPAPNNQGRSSLSACV
jgi:hypothetical protein